MGRIKYIRFPIELWENKELSWEEKVLLFEIESFTKGGRECYISDDYIATFLRRSEATARRTLKRLIENGYVRITRKDGRNRYVETCKANDNTSAVDLEQILDCSHHTTPGIKRDFIKRFIKGREPFPVEDAQKIINAMPYRDFLLTPYWQSISMYIRCRDKKTCQLCGSKKRLNVHHLTYDHHGDELNHLNDLMCVCSKCHKELHKKQKQK